MKLSKIKIQQFQYFIWSFYQEQGRNFAWRNVNDPYLVVVSEIMLQQTQTYRVEKKYDQFIAEFPTFYSLAQATLRDVLTLWQGLGYNRRGMYLHQIAQKVVNNYNGQLPQNPQILSTFPGIGKATASSICAFAFNQPTVFIETNIRTVFIHSFFKNKENVTDNDILLLVEQTVDPRNPCEWYYALMDYGVYLKKIHPNPNRKSKHYIKQSTFEGSDRQIRGKIIKLLTQQNKISKKQLIKIIAKNSKRINKIIEELNKENLIKINGGYIFIA